jgi:hypothetical protein
MQPVELAPCPSPRARSRSKQVAVACLVLVLGTAPLIACGADEVREAAITELAIGSWACAPDAAEASELPFTVQIQGGGTFAVTAETEAGSSSGYEISGTWEVVDSDLRWGFDDVQAREKSVVEGFEALTPESTRFTILWPGIFEANDGTDDPADKQEVLVDANGTDSVTLSVPGGEPWTCDRQ